MAPDHLLNWLGQDGAGALRQRHEGVGVGPHPLTDNTGIDRYGCEIVAETVDFLSRKNEDEDPEIIDHPDLKLRSGFTPSSHELTATKAHCRRRNSQSWQP